MRIETSPEGSSEKSSLPQSTSKQLDPADVSQQLQQIQEALKELAKTDFVSLLLRREAARLSDNIAAQLLLQLFAQSPAAVSWEARIWSLVCYLVKGTVIMLICSYLSAKIGGALL